MFLEMTMKQNQALVELTQAYLKTGQILPDSYVVDVDTLMENARHMLACAKEEGVELYFMLKQLGRNPLLAKRLIDLGFPGAVVVDYKEALLMMAWHIPISHVGNLVQVPHAILEKILLYRPQYMTVFSFEKLQMIHEICTKHQIKQNIILRVYQNDDILYPGQEAGILLDDLESFLTQAKKLHGCEIVGFTAFPCFLFQNKQNDLQPTSNVKTILNATSLATKLGFQIENINLPSGTCSHALRLIKSLGGTSAEPGHGLTGTTPAHAKLSLDEKPCVVYGTEISHHFKGNSYCFGGGYYRRSHVQEALVGETKTKVLPTNLESIDYYMGLEGIHKVHEPVIMAFRFQIFVTRSDVVLVEGLHHQSPKIIGVYDALGREKS